MLIFLLKIRSQVFTRKINSYFPECSDSIYSDGGAATNKRLCKILLSFIISFSVNKSQFF